MELETPLSPFMENSIENFHFVFRITSLVWKALGKDFLQFRTYSVESYFLSI